MTKGEKKVLRGVINKLKSRAWEIHSVSDGEERIKCASLADVIKVVEGVDESWVYLTPPEGGKRHTLYIVLGNDPNGEEVIADSSEHADIEWATTEQEEA
jgi:hypothetical protein